MGYTLGVDLGTTFLAAATASDGRAEMFTLGDRSEVVPSAVYLQEDGTLVTGDAAVSLRNVTSTSRVAREFKRRLGDPTPVVLAGRSFAATELLGAQLRDVLIKVTASEGAPPDTVVLTHPANWGPFRRLLFDGVLQFGGLQSALKVTEPEAAAARYAATRKLPEGALVAVYDLGGGTFDATILRKTGGDGPGMEIVGIPEGIERLGGIDFDEAILRHINYTSDNALNSLDLRDPRTAAALARLRQDCILAKEALSADTETELPVFLPDQHFQVTLTRATFEDLIRAHVESTIGALARTLDSAQVRAEDLTSVLLIGGSSRIPLIARMLSEELGRPIAIDTHPKYAVALGAAAMASRPSEASAAMLSTATAGNGTGTNGSGRVPPPAPAPAAPRPPSAPSPATDVPASATDVPALAPAEPPPPAYQGKPPAPSAPAAPAAPAASSAPAAPASDRTTPTPQRAVPPPPPASAPTPPRPPAANLPQPPAPPRPPAPNLPQPPAPPRAPGSDLPRPPAQPAPAQPTPQPPAQSTPRLPAQPAPRPPDRPGPRPPAQSGPWPPAQSAPRPPDRRPAYQPRPPAQPPAFAAAQRGTPAQWSAAPPGRAPATGERGKQRGLLITIVVAVLVAAGIAAWFSAQPAPAAGAQLVLSTSAVRIGDSYTIRASGFTVGELVDITWTGPTQGSMGAVPADAAGARTQGPIVERDPVGDYLIVATGRQSGRTVQAPLKVLPAR